MKHKNFTITERQLNWLMAQATQVEISDSEYMRRILDKEIDGVAMPPKAVAAADESADKGDSCVIRVRVSARTRLSELAQRTGVNQIDIVNRLVNLPDEQIIAIIHGMTTDLPKAELNKRWRIALPIDGEVTTIDHFLREHCVTAPDLSVPIRPVYASYVEFCGAGSKVEPLEEFLRYIEENASVNVVGVNRAAGLFSRIALRPNAYAVLMGEVSGIEATE